MPAMPPSRLCAALLLAALAGCAAQPRPTVTGLPGPTVTPEPQVPPFAAVPFQPISATAVVAITLREWRLFGQPVDDDFPGTRPPPLPEDKPERQPGLWQRIGEYWWLGVDYGSKESGWTGKTDGQGLVFPASADGDYAWSAAFISYVMRIAGAGPRFPYSESHSTYIDIAKYQRMGATTGWLVVAERPSEYAPKPGDLVCAGRASRQQLTYDDLPAGRFPAHCAIVVAATPGQIQVIGGNVDDAVTLTHVPTTPDGRLAGDDGVVLDPRYPWMVVIRMLYPGVPVASTVSPRAAG